MRLEERVCDGVMCCKSWVRLSLHGRHTRRSEPGQSFFRLFLPLGATKPFGRSRVPPSSFRVLARAFVQKGQLEGHHCVASFFVQRGELRRGVCSRLGLADAGLNLPPVSHGRAL